MDLVKCLICDCSMNFVYSSRATFSAHKKSRKHLAWERGQKSEKVEATRRDNEIYTLKLKISDRDETIERLCVEKAILHATNDHIQLQFELLEKKIADATSSHRSPAKFKIPKEIRTSTI